MQILKKVKNSKFKKVIYEKRFSSSDQLIYMTTLANTRDTLHVRWNQREMCKIKMQESHMFVDVIAQMNWSGS